MCYCPQGRSPSVDNVVGQSCIGVALETRWIISYYYTAIFISTIGIQYECVHICVVRGWEWSSLLLLLIADQRFNWHPTTNLRSTGGPLLWLVEPSGRCWPWWGGMSGLSEQRTVRSTHHASLMFSQSSECVTASGGEYPTYVGDGKTDTIVTNKYVQAHRQSILFNKWMVSLHAFWFSFCHKKKNDNEKRHRRHHFVLIISHIYPFHVVRTPTRPNCGEILTPTTAWPHGHTNRQHAVKRTVGCRLQ